MLPGWLHKRGRMVKLRSGFFLLALAAPGMVMAITLPPPAPPVYQYTFTLPGVIATFNPNSSFWSFTEDDTAPTWTYTFDWSGFFQSSSSFNDLVGTPTVTGTPVQGWTYNPPEGYSFNSPAKITIDFLRDNSFGADHLQFYLSGTDGFWQQTGSRAFDPNDPNNPSNAGFGYFQDPACNPGMCTVDTELSTPEPSSWIMLLTVFAIGGFLIVRKRLHPPSASSA
jgi:hypothetical protein